MFEMRPERHVVFVYCLILLFGFDKTGIWLSYFGTCRIVTYGRMNVTFIIDDIYIYIYIYKIRCRRFPPHPRTRLGKGDRRQK